MCGIVVILVIKLLSIGQVSELYFFFDNSEISGVLNKYGAPYHVFLMYFWLDFQIIFFNFKRYTHAAHYFTSSPPTHHTASIFF